VRGHIKFFSAGEAPALCPPHLQIASDAIAYTQGWTPGSFVEAEARYRSTQLAYCRGRGREVEAEARQGSNVDNRGKARQRQRQRQRARGRGEADEIRGKAERGEARQSEIDVVCVVLISCTMHM